MASRDLTPQFDLGVTSVRLIRVGNVVQLEFSKKLAAAFTTRRILQGFKKAEGEFRP